MTVRHRSPVHARSRSHRHESALYRAASSPVSRAAVVGVAAVGLAALAIAIFGPKRFQQVVVQPVRSAVVDQTERLWTEAQPLRNQLTSLMARAASDSTREKLVRSFQSWIGHFKAS